MTPFESILYVQKYIESLKRGEESEENKELIEALTNVTEYADMNYIHNVEVMGSYAIQDLEQLKLRWLDAICNWLEAKCSDKDGNWIHPYKNYTQLLKSLRREMLKKI